MTQPYSAPYDQPTLATEADLVAMGQQLAAFEGQEQVDQGREGDIAVQATPSRRVILWHIPTASPRVVLRDLLPAAMEQVDENGQKVFSITEVKPRFVGTLRCPLHPEDEYRSTWTQMGLPICNVANLDNEYERQQHLKIVHRQQSQVIETELNRQREERRERERQEDRAERQALLQHLTSMPTIVQQPTQAAMHRQHRYAGTEAGSPCTFAGCDAIRPE